MLETIESLGAAKEILARAEFRRGEFAFEGLQVYVLEAEEKGGIDGILYVALGERAAFISADLSAIISDADTYRADFKE